MGCEDGNDSVGSRSEEHRQGTWWGRRADERFPFNEFAWHLDFEGMRFPVKAPPRRGPRRRWDEASYDSDDSDLGAGKQPYSYFQALQWSALERLNLRGVSLALESTRLPVRSAPRLRRLVLQDSVRASGCDARWSRCLLWLTVLLSRNVSRRHSHLDVQFLRRL